MKREDKCVPSLGGGGKDTIQTQLPLGNFVDILAVIQTQSCLGMHF